jgi:hypothetical protein
LELEVDNAADVSAAAKIGDRIVDFVAAGGGGDCVVVRDL